jgi:phosphatidylserine decarboxylase
MVGAFGVRAIEVTLPGLEPGERWGVPDGGVQVARAEEIGVFHLGSTVVVFWEKSSQMTVRSGQSVRFGQRLASW